MPSDLTLLSLKTTGLQPAATFVNCVYIYIYVLLKFRGNLGSWVYHLLLFFVVQPASQSTITGVALWQKNAGDPSNYATLFFWSSMFVLMRLDLTPLANVTPWHTYADTEGRWNYSSNAFETSALGWDGWLAPHPSRVTPGVSRYPLYRGLLTSPVLVPNSKTGHYAELVLTIYCSSHRLL